MRLARSVPPKPQAPDRITHAAHTAATVFLALEPDFFSPFGAFFGALSEEV